MRRKRREDHTSVSGSSWTTCAYHVRNATRRAPGWKREDVKIPATKLPTRIKSKCIKAGPSVISTYIRVRAQRARENPEARTFVYFNPHTYIYLGLPSHPTTAPRNPELQISVQQIPQISAAIIIPSSELHRLMQTTAFCFKTRRVPVLPTKSSCPFALNGRLMTRVRTRFLVVLH